MPELAIVGPLGELHLSDEIWAHPMWRFVGFDRRGEGRLRDRARLQEGPDSRQLLVIEAGAGVADVDERAGVVEAEEERRPTW